MMPNPRSTTGGGGRVEVALTGGVACGKTEVARIWMGQGIPVLDTDRVAHEVMAPGTTVYRQVVAAFGRDLVGADGQIDRAKLGPMVFADEAVRMQLNQLVHPAVREVWQNWRKQQRAAGESVAVAIPLLFEVGAHMGWDAVVCVTATRERMMERLEKRGLSREESSRRIAAQLAVEEKAKRSDFIIENNGTLQELENRALATWRQILARQQA